MPLEISLAGKTALITGGARGIGAEICRQMANAGANIVINYYDCEQDRQAVAKLEPELRAMNVGVLSVCADVSKEDEVTAMAAAAEAAFGGVDILVNNAGITISPPFEEMTARTWKTMTGVILDGAFYATRAVIGRMLQKGRGSIIMITTNCTVNGGGGSAAYPAAKSGVEGMVRQLVLEYAAKGIRTNIIRPAVIDTDLFRQRYATDRQVEEYGKKIPVGHVGKPSDIAYAAVFLASDKAEYICGESLLVDGGRTYYK